MFALIASQLIWLYLNFSIADHISIVLVFLLFVAGWRQFKTREAYLVGVCFILAALAYFTSDQMIEWALDGLSRAAYLAAFILLMALLREGAMESSSVLQLGHYLTMQPPQRRFVAVFSGAHALAVMVNLGALSLLAPIIQRGVRAKLPPGAPLDEVALIRERRQLTATLRGFCWFLVWAPTAVTQAVMPTLMSGIDALRLIGLGWLLALIMLVISWTDDWIRWRAVGKQLRESGRVTQTATPAFPAKPARNFLLVCAMLFFCSISFSKLANVTIVTGVMLTAPLVVLVWLLVQQRNSGGLSGTNGRLSDITFIGLPAYIREAIFVACAGFIGTIGAQLVPIDEIADIIGLSTMPGWIVLWILSLTVLFFGQVGLSPITMAIFLGSLIAQIDVLPVDMTHAALAIAAGTAICTVGAPFSAGALMLSRATNISPITLTWKWNGLYTIITTVGLALFYMVLAGL